MMNSRIRGRYQSLSLALVVSVCMACRALPSAFATPGSPGDDPPAAAPQDKPQRPQLTTAELETLVADLEKQLEKKSDSNLRFNLAERYLQLAEAVADSDSRRSLVYWSRSCELNDELCDLISTINLQMATQFKHFFSQEGEPGIVDPVQVATRARELSVKLAPKIDDPQQRILLTIKADRLLGTFQALSSQLKDAQANLAHAVENATAASKDYPQSNALRLQLAKAHHTLGIINLQRRDMKATVASFEAMIEHCRALSAQAPKDRECRHLLSRGLGEYSALMQLLGKLPEAQTHAQECVTVAAQLADDFPSSQALQLDLASAHNRLGTILIKADDLATAHTHLNSARQIHTATGSATPFASNELAGAMVNLAVVFYKTDKAQEARELLMEARPIHLKALEAEPQNGLFRHFFRNNRSVLILSCLKLKNHSEAFATIDELLKHSDNPADRFMAAKSAAECINIAKSDKNISSADLDSMLSKYSQLAIMLLDDLAQKEMIDATHLDDEQFKSLESVDDFKKLKAKLK